MPALSPEILMRAALCLVVAALLAALSMPGAGQTDLGDIVFARKEGSAGGIAPAVFPHWLHRMQYRCYACHDEPFKMKAGSNAITMDAINNGKMCGVCHDGKTAFGPTVNTCSRCHRD